MRFVCGSINSRADARERQTILCNSSSFVEAHDPAATNDGNTVDLESLDAACFQTQNCTK
jgi:hypothetical protein